MPDRPLTTAVWLDSGVHALIEHETLLRPKVETGGALFGFGDDDGLVVACAYGPGPRAKHRRTTFEPHPETTQALIDAVWHASDARYRYLGSWHSHPGSLPRPSSTDISTTEAVAGEHAVALPEPLVLIQGTRRRGRDTEIGDLRAWRWSGEDAWLLPCELIPIELGERGCPIVHVPAGRRRRAAVVSPRPAAPGQRS